MNKSCEYLTNNGCAVCFKVVGEYRHLPPNVCNKNCNPEQLTKRLRSMPPVTQQLKNAASATGQAVKSGFKTVSKEEQDRRFTICETCEFLTDRILKRCSKCGCCVNLKKKLEAWHCPIYKW